MGKNKALYNYLVNTFGISKEMVMDHIDKRLNGLISKHLHSKLNSKYVENLILNKVAQITSNGFNDGWYSREMFETYVKKCLREILVQVVNDEMTVELKMVRKDTKVI